MILHWSCILAALFAFMIIISAFKYYIFTAIFASIAFISSALAYFRFSIDFSLNTMILDIVFQNDVTISADMVTYHVILWCCFITTIAILIAIARLKYPISPRKPQTYIILIIAAFSLAFLLNPNGRFARPISERIPFNIYNVSKKYISERQEIATSRPRSCSYANANNNVKTIVVIGEALRPMNLGFNGYHRNTTPRLAKRNVISYPNVFSQYVYTNRSVPHILTRADSINPNRAFSERSFIDVFKCANIKSSFIANQDAEKPYIYFMKEADEHINANTSKTVYNFEKWLDIDVIHHLKKSITPTDSSQLIVIHTIGSHWWYNSHFSDEYAIFKPIMKSRIVTESDSIEIVNSYDNTILYTDMVLDSIIASFENQNAVLLFLSDHGEALGENGKWLHASSSSVMNRTASFIWMSDMYKATFPEKYNAAVNNKNNKYNTDYFFHSVIDAADIKTDILDSSLSIFK